MNSAEKLRSEIRALEEKLLHTNWSESSGNFDDLIAAEFWEISSRGEIHFREVVCDWLRNKADDARWELDDFAVGELGPGLILATYLARQVKPVNTHSKGSRHCSLWQRGAPKSSWLLLFHQATKIL